VPGPGDGTGEGVKIANLKIPSSALFTAQQERLGRGLREGRENGEWEVDITRRLQPAFKTGWLQTKARGGEAENGD